MGESPFDALNEPARAARRATFFGSYRYAIDDKGRLTLPTPMRLALADGAVLSPMNARLVIWPRASFNLAVAAVWHAHDDAELVADDARVFNNLAQEITPDGQGRIVIPTAVRMDCELERDVIVLGSGPRIEIVPDNDFENERLRSMSNAVPNLLDRLGL